MSIEDCQGCEAEMYECYEWQSRGYDAGLEFNEEHCFVFVFNKKGRIVVW